MKYAILCFLFLFCLNPANYAQIETVDQAKTQLQQAAALVASKSPKQAKDILEQVLFYYREHQHPEDLGAALCLLGRIYYDDHDYGRALDYFKEAEALLINEELLDQLPQLKILLSSTYSNLDYRRVAIHYGKEAVEYAKLTKNHDQYLEAAGNLSMMYYRYQEYDSATYFANVVIENAETQDAKKLADVYTTLHGVHRLQRNYPQAIQYAQKALGYCKEYYGERHPYTGYGEYYLGWTYRNMGQWAKALPHLQRALIYNHQTFSDTSVFSFPDPTGILHLDYQLGFLDYKLTLRTDITQLKN